MTPGEIRFALDRTLLAHAESGRVPLIVGVHSIVVEGDTVHVNYDTVPYGVMLFEYERPAVVGKDDVGHFTAWLAFSHDETAH